MESPRVMPNHLSAGMMWRINPATGKLEFLTLTYQEVGRPGKVRKFPAGTNRLSRKPLVYRDETPLETLCREFPAETGLTLTGCRSGSYQRPIGPHTQHFFVIDEENGVGELRTVEKVDSEEGRPDEILGSMEWTPAEDLQMLGGRYEMKGAHREGLDHAIPIIDHILGGRNWE